MLTIVAPATPAPENVRILAAAAPAIRRRMERFIVPPMFEFSGKTFLPYAH